MKWFYEVRLTISAGHGDRQVVRTASTKDEALDLADRLDRETGMTGPPPYCSTVWRVSKIERPGKRP